MFDEQVVAHESFLCELLIEQVRDTSAIELDLAVGQVACARRVGQFLTEGVYEVALGRVEEREDFC